MLKKTGQFRAQSQPRVTKQQRERNDEERQELHDDSRRTRLRDEWWSLAVTQAVERVIKVCGMIRVSFKLVSFSNE